jgi:monothiol glutaredoxin
MGVSADAGRQSNPSQPQSPTESNMPRPILDEANLHPAIRAKVSDFQQAILAEVFSALKAHKVVVVGMRQNPFPKKARKALNAAGVAHHYIEYGSYLGMWRQRLALKMWTGWPTIPMVFVKGMLVGGFDDLQKLIASGELKTMLA